MSTHRLAQSQNQPFVFSEENLRFAQEEIKKYPKGKQASAVVALLWRAQQQSGGWLPEEAITYVADFLDMPPIRVLELVSFYSMFHLEPVGQYDVQLCGTTPCWLNGADNLRHICRRHIGEEGAVTRDGRLSWREVECLGACVDAPIVQINEDYYERLDPDELADLINRMKRGEDIQPKGGGALDHV